MTHCTHARPNCGCARPNWSLPFSLPWSSQPQPPPPDARQLTQQLVQQLVDREDLPVVILPDGGVALSSSVTQPPTLFEQAVPYIFAFGVGGAVAVLASNFVRRR